MATNTRKLAALLGASGAGIADAGTINTAGITNDAINADKIVANAVGTSEVADNVLTATDLAANSVGSSELDADTRAGKVITTEVKPHIIPGVLQPAIAGKLLNGATHSGAYGTAQTQSGGDGHKYYYTDIKGSKPIKDPRIGAYFGSQRHKFKSLQLLEQETATHGNDVFSIDGREWCRLVNTGSVKFIVENSDAGNGLNVSSHTFTAFFEITGYFNDFNCISWTKSDRADDINVTVNGGTTRNSANTDKLAGKATATTPLNGRYVDAGSVINHGDSDVASDLGTTPSINTIKIEAINTGSEYWRFYGIELIAQDTSNRNNIQIPAQNVVSYGKKFSVSAAATHYNPFDGMSGAKTLTQLGGYIDTATSLGMENWKAGTANYYKPWNGGRVIKWVDSSGAIKTSVTMMPPNAQNFSATASNAISNTEVQNGTNGETINFDTTTLANATPLSEVAKSFLMREFGNGAANGGTAAHHSDASMLTGNDAIGYVMDDGLTCLAATEIEIAGSGTANAYGYVASTSDAHNLLTFIGTGFGFRNKTSSGDNRHSIVQNLPYGTHIFDQILSGSDYPITFDGVSLGNHRPNSRNTDFGLYEVTIYQPKKPPIPENAVVLADYMLMANYVKQTAATFSGISKGMRFIHASRDILYDTPSGTLVYQPSSNSSATVRPGATPHGIQGASGQVLTSKLTFFGTTAQGYGDRGARTTTLNGTAKASTNLQHASQDKCDVHTLASGVDLGVVTVSEAQPSGSYVTTGFAVNTPIHTSHHYQPFETPFLNELVGGDRNMEQTNLVCSPDGKTWDEVTRDTSYLGTSGFLVTEPQDTGGAVQDLIFTEFRGVSFGSACYNKNFAIAYDRFICLEDGLYYLKFQAIEDTNSQASYIKVNGTVVAASHTIAATWSSPNNSTVVQLKGGDYINVSSPSSENKSYVNFIAYKIR